jgi:hypothetical protein
MKKAEKMREAKAVNDAERQETAPEDTGRDARGRFTAGNAGGPGNPFARRVASLRTILLECVNDEEMRHIAGQLVVMAKAGDLAAIKLLFQYVLGKPAVTVDPDTLDQQEVEWFCREPPGRLVEELAGTRMPSEMVARFCRDAMPIAGQAQAQMIREAWLHPEEDLLDEDDEDDEDDFDDDEEEGEEANAAGVCATGAPSPNGEKAADPRPRATRPSQNGRAGAAKPGSAPADAGRNRRAGRRPGGRTFIDPRQSE